MSANVMDQYQVLKDAAAVNLAQVCIDNLASIPYPCFIEKQN